MVDTKIHCGVSEFINAIKIVFPLIARVMTVSFHKYGDNFFPGTGNLADIGEKNGRYYSLNVPLRDGLDDATFGQLFQPIMAKVMEVFKPGAIVMQCGML